MRTWDKLWKAPNILGSFIWEWQSQGIADKNEDTTQDFFYGPDHLRDENNKGIVDGYRHPKPEVVDRQKRLQPGRRPRSHRQPGRRHLHGSGHEPLLVHQFKRADLPLDRALSAGGTLQSGVLPIACAPMQSTVTASFPAPAGMTVLRLEFLHPDGSAVIAYNLAVAGVPLPCRTCGPGLRRRTDDAGQPEHAHGSAMPVQQITFDKHTGTIQSWHVNGDGYTARRADPELGRSES